MLSQLITARDRYNHILIAPLNWGLGHATRMIPIINHCIRLGKTVTLASDGDALELLRREFPELIYYELPAYDIKYAKHNTSLKIISQAPKIALKVNAESKAIARIVKECQPDLIISDNRLGVRHPDIESVVVTHQVNLISPVTILNKPALKLNITYLNKFDAVWIMDHPDRRLSGKLSIPDGLNNFRYIGSHSRLQLPSPEHTIAREILVILSGPEPQRTILEEALLDTLSKEEYRYHIIRGTTSPLNRKYKQQDSEGHISHLVKTKKLNTLINTSNIVITRTGYTSVMDLDALQKKAILIPTPGQSEQVYLGEHLKSHPLFIVLEQNDIETQLGSILDRMLS